MQKKIQKIDYAEDGISFNNIISILFSSKYFIILTTLVFTISTVFLTYQKVQVYKLNALLEIGQYNSINNENILIETAPNLIQDLNIVFIHKSSNPSTRGLVFQSIEDKLINIQLITPYIEKGNNIINQVADYISNKHSNIFINSIQESSNKIISQIERINSEIEFGTNALIIENEDKKIVLLNEIESLNNQIEFGTNALIIENEDNTIRLLDEIERGNNLVPSLAVRLQTIDKKISALNTIILDDQANLKLLKSNPELLLKRAAESPTLDQVIYTYKNTLLDLIDTKQHLLSDLKSLKKSLAEDEKLLENKKNNLYPTNSLQLLKLSKLKNSLESQLALLNRNFQDSGGFFTLSQEKGILESQLALLNRNFQDSGGFFTLSQEKGILEKQLELSRALTLTSAALVGDITTSPIPIRKNLIIFFGFIIGMFLSIFLVFLSISFKTIKKSKA